MKNYWPCLFNVHKGDMPDKSPRGYKFEIEK